MARVLFIEDDPGWQDVLRRLLETAGHEPQRATTFEAALGCLSGKKQFDVIVFDLRLGDKPTGSDPFVWLDALIQGMTARQLRIPPVIIVTGVDVSKQEVIQAFTEYRGHTFSFFEKKDLDPKQFLQSVTDAAGYLPGSRSRPRSFFHLLAYAVLMAAIVLLTFGILLWSVSQVADPKTQQTILQVGGAVIVVIAVFITVFSQNTRLENVIDSVTKIWGG